MGHQQKLLYVSGIIAVTVAILAGLQKFRSESSDAEIRHLKLDLLTIAAKAQAYYHKSASLQGGNNSFSGLTADAAGLKRLLASAENQNGTFSILQVAPQQILLQAIGKDDYDSDGQNMTVQMIVFPDSTQTTVISY